MIYDTRELNLPLITTVVRGNYYEIRSFSQLHHDITSLYIPITIDY